MLVEGVAKRGRRGRHAKTGRVTPKGTRPRRPSKPKPVHRQPGRPSPTCYSRSANGCGRASRSTCSPRSAPCSRWSTGVKYGLGRRPGEPPYTLRQLVDTFLDVDRIETTALLAVDRRARQRRRGPGRWHPAGAGAAGSSAAGVSRSVSARPRCTGLKRWSTCWATATTSTSPFVSPEESSSRPSSTSITTWGPSSRTPSWSRSRWRSWRC